MIQHGVPIEELTPISISLLKVGQSLPYDLYNARGKFISAKDYIFKNEMEISMMSQSKPMRLKTDEDFKTQLRNDTELKEVNKATGSIEQTDTSLEYGGGELLTVAAREHDFSDYKANRDNAVRNGAKVSVVALINQLIATFPKLHKAFYDDSSTVLGILKTMETKLFRIIEQDKDAAIGLIHISEIKSQAEHCVFSAILAGTYSKTIGYPDRFVRLVVTSAFCMNLGAIELHEELNSKDTKLCDDLISKIRKHSEESVALTATAGIKHPTIINAILHHHERPDGEGYPAGLRSEEIPDEALIIGIVDTYLAMIGPRAYRNKVEPKEALKRVLFEGHKYDNDFYTTFIKAIGVYPAGTFHELNSGEIVVVIRRDPKHATKPEICTLINAAGEQVSELETILLSSSNQTIKKPHPGGRGLHIPPEVLWD